VNALAPAPRLLAINNYYYRRGGAESVFLDEMQLFAGIGWDVVPFAMRHPKNFATEWADYFVDEIEYGHSYGPLTKVRQAASIIYSREAQKKLAALIERRRPTVAHAHNVYHHLSPAIFPTLRRAGVPTVMTVHDLKLACPAYKMLRDGKVCERCKGGHIENVLLNRCIKGSVALSGLVLLETMVHRGLGLYRDNVDRFVVPSRFYRDKLVEWGFPAESLVYIPNFVSVPEAPPGIEEGDYFLFAGRLAPEKGIATLIRAAGRSGQKLVIAGTGEEEQALRRLAEAEGAAVQFAGYLSGEPLTRLMAAAKALVLPSEWYENAPVSVLEAYGLGRPVIGTSIGGIPELIRPGETGLVARPSDPDDLARALAEMAALTPDQRATMGAAGRDWVRRDFSPDLHRERLLDLYQSLGVMA
jgi:glycosyltransferase involved in cell wall biosynthesis